MNDDITGEEWLDILLAASREDRVRMANWAVEVTADQKRGRDCRFRDHDERIKHLDERVRTAGRSLDDLEVSVAEMSEAAQPGVHAVIDRLRSDLGLWRAA